MIFQTRTMCAVALLFTMALCLTLGLTSGARADDPDPDVFELNIQFTVGVQSYSGGAVTRMNNWIDQQVARAEELHDRSPALNITRTIVRATEVGGVNLARLQFDNLNDYHKFMDEHFDTIPTGRHSGTFQALIVDRLCIGNDCMGGAAFLPRWTTPFQGQRKHGIVLRHFNTADDFIDDDDPLSGLGDPRDWLLAHELGHVFALHHTFRKYHNVDGRLNCNKAYPKTPDELTCNSCTGTVSDGEAGRECDASFNVMDYCLGTNDTFLNACQERRAANQRKTYMTGDGWTDYFKLKGSRGTQACKKDTDCNTTSEYCDKGTITIGKNVCAPKRNNGTKCTRKKQCLSNKCRVGKCKA